MTELRGAVVAVTGGARGIGRATAEAFERAGARVAVGDLDPPARRLDVTDPASFAAFLDGVEADLGPLDVLVNNAGIMLTGPFAGEDPLRAARMLDINLGGVVTGSRLAVDRMLPRGRGHVVNVASMAGKAGYPGGVTYCASKFGVVGLSEALHAELRGTGVGVSLVMPAAVQTELTSGLDAGRLARPVEPSVVGAAIVGAVRSGRFDVFVPRAAGPATHVMAALPRRLRERLARTLGADRYLLNADADARAAYLRRTS